MPKGMTPEAAWEHVVSTVTDHRGWPLSRGLQQDAHLTRAEAALVFGDRAFEMPLIVAGAIEMLTTGAASC